MKSSLYFTWDKLSTSNISKKEKTKLLKSVYNLSLFFIIRKYHKNKLFELSGISAENLAIETTVFLFTKNKMNRLRIIDFLYEFSQNGFSSANWHYHFVRMIEKSVDMVIRFNEIKWDLVEIKK